MGKRPNSSQGIPRDAFSTLGRYPAGFSHPGVKRYYVYGMWPPPRERDLHFSVAWERSIVICEGRLCEGTELHIYHGTVGFVAGFDCCVMHASDAFLINVTHFRSLPVLVGSCSCQRVTCKRSVGGCFRSPLVRDAFVRERDMIIFAGRDCAGTGFTHFRSAGAGYYNVCGTRYVSAGSGFHIYHGTTGYIPHKTAG